MLQIKNTRTDFWARVQDAFFKSAPEEILAQPLLCQLVADFNNDKTEAWVLAEQRLPEWHLSLQVPNSFTAVLRSAFNFVAADIVVHFWGF